VKYHRQTVISAPDVKQAFKVKRSTYWLMKVPRHIPRQWTGDSFTSSYYRCK